MNEKYLRAYFDANIAPNKADATYEDWVSKISTNEEYKSNMFKTHVASKKPDADYNDWNTKVFGQPTTAPEKKNLIGTPSQNGSQGLPDTQALPSSEPTRATPLEGLGGQPSNVPKTITSPLEAARVVPEEDPFSKFEKSQGRLKELAALEGMVKPSMLPSIDLGDKEAVRKKINDEQIGIRSSLQDVQPKLDLAVNRMLSEIDSDLTAFTTKDINGLPVADTEKAAEFARKKAKELGLPEDGHAWKYIWNKAKDHAAFKIVEPEVNKEFAKSYEKMFGKPLEQDRKDVAERVGGVSGKVAKADAGIDLFAKQQLEEANQFAEQDLVQRLGGLPPEQYVVRAKAAYDQSIAAINQTFAGRITPEGFAGSEEEYKVYKTQIDQIERQYEEAASKLTESAVAAEYGANRRYQRNVQEYADGVYRGLNQEIEKNLKPADQFIQNRIRDAYKDAYGKVAENNEWLKGALNRSAGSELIRPMQSAVGGSLKAIGTMSGSQDMQVYGDYLQNRYNIGSAEIEEWSDWFTDYRLALRSTGQLMGSMSTSMVPAFAVGALTSGLGAAPTYAALAGGSVAFLGETTDLSGRMYDQTFAETGDAGLATERAKKTFDSQMYLAPTYALEMLPFVGKFSGGVAKRFFKGASMEYITETFLQEYPQNAIEKAIMDDAELSEVYRYMSFEDLEKTAKNTVSVALMGGGGQINQYFSEEQKAKENLEKNIKSISAQAALGKTTEAQAQETILNIVANHGVSTADAVISAAFNGNEITYEQASILLSDVKAAEEYVKGASELGLSDKNAYVFTNLRMKLREAERQAENEKDPAMKSIKGKRATKLKKDMEDMFNGGESRYTTLTFPNGSFQILTYDEARKKMKEQGFGQTFIDGGLRFEAFGNEAPQLQDELKSALEGTKPTQEEYLAEIERRGTPVEIPAEGKQSSKQSEARPQDQIDAEIRDAVNDVYRGNRLALEDGFAEFQGQRQALRDAGGMNYHAHGMGKSTIATAVNDLLGLFNNGLDKSRNNGRLYTAPLGATGQETGGATASGAYADSPFMLVSATPEITDMSQVVAILVNDGLVNTSPQLIALLQERFPSLTIETYSNAANAVTTLNDKQSNKQAQAEPVSAPPKEETAPVVSEAAPPVVEEVKSGDKFTIPERNESRPTTPKTWGSKSVLSKMIDGELRGVIERGVPIQEWINKGYGNLLSTWSNEARTEFVDVVNEKINEIQSEKTPTAQPFLSTLGGTPVKGPSETMAEGVFQTEVDGVDVLMSEPDANTVKLESIRTPKSQQRQGKAKAVLAKITAEADKQGKTIVLDVVPEGKSTTEEGLRKLYESAGFVADGKTSMRREPVSEESKIEEAPIVVSEDKVTQEEVDEDILSLEDLRSAMSKVVSKEFAESPEGQARKLARTYTNMGKRGRKTPLGVQVFADLQKVVKDNGYTLQPNKTGGFTVLDKNSKPIKKPKAASSKEEKAEKKTERKEIKETRSAALMMNPISIEHWVAQRIASGTRFKKSELLSILGSKADIVPWLWAEKGLSLEGGDFIQQLKDEGLTGTFDERTAQQDAITEIARYAMPNGKQAALDYAESIYEESQKSDEDPYAGYTEEDYLEIEEYRKRANLAMNPDLAIEIMSLEFMPEDVAQHVLDNMKAQEEYESSTQYLSDIQKQIKGYEDKQKGKRKNATGKKADGDTSEATTEPEVPTEGLTPKYKNGSTVADRYKKGIYATFITDEGEIDPREKGAWRSMGPKEFMSLLNGAKYNSREMKKGNYFSPYPAYSANVVGKGKFLVEFGEKTTEGEVLTSKADRKDITGVWQHNGKGWVKISAKQVEKLFIEQNQPQTEKPKATQTELFEGASEAAKIAKRLRDKKIGGVSFVDPLFGAIGISKSLYDGALELAARQVEKGTKLGTAIANAIKYIDERMSGKKWDKGLFGRHLNDQFKMTVAGKEVEVKRDLSEETLEVVNGWYSPLEKSIKDTKADSLTAKEWLDKVRSKEGEDFWTGLRGVLEAKNPKERVSKRELLNFLKDNRVDVVEAVKGGDKDVATGIVIDGIEVSKNEKGEYDVYYKGSLVNDGFATERYALNYVASNFNNDISKNGLAEIRRLASMSEPSKFSKYQLEGEKENYKEVLVTLPSNGLSDSEKDEFSALYQKSNNEGYLSRKDLDRYNELSKKQRRGRDTNFRSSHFDEPNIVVHLRMNTRKDADGNKVLFLEEVQSDFGQSYKKGTTTIKAPFVTDTNSWVKLAVKVALKEAVAQGVDKIAWTTGEQQNERYDLSKSVDRISVYRNTVDGKRTANAVIYLSGNNSPVDLMVNRDTGIIDSVNSNHDTHVGKRLEDVIGKEMSEKIISETNGFDDYTGNDLKIGGKGMKGFYGSPKENSKGILGSVVESITGQKVGKTSLDTGDAKYDAEKYNGSQDVSGIPGNSFIKKGDWLIKDPNGNYVWSEEGNLSKSEAVENFKEASVGADNSINEGMGVIAQPSIEITPELKSAVEKGQPLFGSNLGLEKARQDLKDAWKAFKDEGKNLGFADTPGNKGKRLADLEIAVQKALIAFARKYVASVADKAKLKVEDIFREFVNNGVDMTRRIAEDILDVVVPPSERLEKPKVKRPEQSGVKKTVQTKRAYEGNIRQEVKDFLEENGLTRMSVSMEKQSELAKEFIDKYGEDVAIEAVRNGDVTGGQAASIIAQVIKSIDEQMSELTSFDTDELSDLSKRQSEAIILLGDLAYKGGAFNAQLAFEYENSDIGYNVEKKISEYKDRFGEIEEEVEKKFREWDSERKDLKKKLAKAVEAAEKAQEKAAIEAIKGLGGRPSVTYKQRAKRVADDFRKLKTKPLTFTDSNGNKITITEQGVISWNALIEIGAKAIELTGEIADGVKAMKDKLSEADWFTKLSKKDQEAVLQQIDDHFYPQVSEETTEGPIRISKTLLRELVENGVDNIEDLVAAVKEAVQDEYPDITDREVRDAITQYGKTINIDRDGINKELRRLKEIGRIISQLEDVASKKRPVRSGIQREKFEAEQEAEIRALKKQLREAMKDLPVDSETEARQLATSLDAAKNRVKNQIEDLQREIDRLERIDRKGRSIKQDAELTELIERRDAIKAVHEETFKNDEKATQQKINAAIRAIERSIEEYDRRISEKELEAKKKPSPIASAEIAAAKKQLEERKAFFRQMQEDAGIVEKKRLELAKNRTKARIKELERRIADKDFQKTKPKPLKEDAELLDLQAELLRVNEKFDKEFHKKELENRTKKQKTIDAIWDAWGLTRVLMATGEASFVGIQGGIMTISHPLNAIKAFKNSIRFLTSEKKTEEWLRKVKSEDYYPALKKSKLALTEPHARLTAREELYYSDWAEVVWKMISFPLKFISESARNNFIAANPIKAIERAAIGYLDTHRLLRYLDGVEVLESQGKTFESNPQDYKDVADAINTLTGRASLGDLELFAETLSKVFFSPRNWASQFKTATPYALYHFGKMTPTARKMAIADFSKFVGITTGFVMMAAAALNGDDDDETGVEFDPRSSDFMKIKIGDRRIDPWGGRIQQIVLSSRIIMEMLHDFGPKGLVEGGMKKPSGEVIPLGTPYKSPTMLNTGIQMAINKLSPSAHLLVNYLETTENKEGVMETPYGEAYSPTDDIKSSLKPIFWETVNELIIEDPSALNGLITAGAFFGVNANVYESSKRKKSKSETSIKESRKEKDATVQEIKDSEVERLKTELKGDYVDPSNISKMNVVDTRDKLSGTMKKDDVPSKSKLRMELAERHNAKLFSEKDPDLARIFVTDEGEGNRFGDDYLIMASQYKDSFLEKGDPLKIKDGDEKKIMEAMKYLGIVERRKHIQKVNKEFKNIPTSEEK